MIRERALKIVLVIAGLDLNAEGIRNANALAEQKKLGGLCQFQECDASQPLPIADESFDAVFSNDVLCHVPGPSGCCVKFSAC